MTYTAFLEGLRLRYFSANEVVRQGYRERDGTTNSLPPPEMWDSIVPTLWVADQARHILGFPLAITSAYRSEEYNRAVGGAAASEHKENTALDLIPPNGRVERLHETLKRLRRSGAFSGGLGSYSNFVHIDTRGINATWWG